jgi:PAS domain S-box-containing protein
MSPARLFASFLPQSRQGRSVTWFGGLLISVIVALAGYDIVRSYQAAVANTGRELDSHARVIAEQTARSMQAVDVVLRNLVEQFRAGTLPALSRDDLHAYLKAQAAGLVQVDGLVYFEADGSVRAVSLLPPAQQPPAINVAHVDIFQQLRARRDVGLAIGRAVRSDADGQWRFPVGRRLESSSGVFAGVVGARGHIDYFEHFYRDVQAEPGTAITLMQLDGSLLARHPHAEGALGRRFPMLDDMLAAHYAGRAEPWRVVSPVDGVDRFGTLQLVADYPLVVVVTRDADVALAPWRDQAMGTAVRTLVLAVLAAVLLALLQSQVTRLVAARRSLEASQERFGLAVAGSDDGIWDWDYRSGEAFASQRARDILGLPPGPETESIDQWFAQLEQQLHPEDRPRRIEAIQAHLSGASPTYEGEYRVRTPEGGYRWIRIRGLCVRRGSGQPVRMAGSVSDVDSRKRAEESLRQSEERYALAMTGSSGGHWVWDVATDALFVSGKVNELFGLPADTPVTTRSAYVPHVTLHPDDRDAVARVDADLLQGGATRTDFEYRILLEDGTTRWILTRAQCFRDEAGRPLRVAGVSVDISDRKRTELALRLSEERYALAMTGSNEGHWVWDLASDELFVSRTMNEIFGLPPDTRSTSWTTFLERITLHPDDLDRVKQVFRNQLARRTMQLDVEHRIVLPDGRVRWVHTRGRCFCDPAGKVERLAGATVDVSDRKHAEELLRQSEERYALAMTGSNEGHWVWELASDELYASPKLYEIYGLPPEQRLSTRTDFIARVPIHPDDVVRVDRAVEDHIAGRSARYDIEFRVVARGGEVRWVHARGQCFRDEAGRPLRMAGSTVDVTERKRTEDALRKSEERFALSVAGSNDGIIDWDIVNDELYASERAQQILGIESGVTVRPRDQWRAMFAYHPEDAARAEEDIRRCLAGETELRDGEYRVCLPGGGYRWVRHRNKVLHDAAGRPVRLSGSVSDIDAHKRAEQALRESEERSALAVAGSDDGIWHWNFEARVGFGSARSREILGLPPGPEVMPLETWFAAYEAQLHPDDVPRRREAIDAHLAGRIPWYEGEYRVRDADGTERWIRVRGLCVRGEDGRPLRMAGSLSDIDARRRAEDALRRSEERYAIAMTGSHEAHWVWELDQDRIHVSPLLNELFGLPPQTQVVPVRQFFSRARLHPDDKERVFATVNEHIAGTTPRLDVEYRIVARDTGVVRWVHTRAQCFRDATGHPDRMAGATVEVTERRRAEQALRESEERYALAIAGSNDGIIDWDIVNDRMFTSERAMRILGIESDVTVRTRAEWMALVDIHPDDRQRHDREMADHLEGRTPIREGEYRVRQGGGEYRWVRVRGLCVRDANGRAVRLAGSVSDIDKQKRTEEALRRSEERYQLAVDGSNEGLWDWDLASDTLFLSPRAQELLWLQPCEPVQARRFWIDRTPYHPEDLALVRRAISDHLHGVTPHFAVEYRLRHHSGEWRWYRQRGVAVRDENGRPYRMAGSMENITARKNAEAQRDRLEVQLRQAQKLEAIGTLAGGIAHDFNNILAAILGYGEMAQKDAPEGTAQRRHIDAAISAGMRAKSLVERILAFSRSGMGERVPVHVQSVVLEALELVGASLPGGVTLQRELGAPEAAVLGDPTQVHQVVMNLCANSVQAMKSRGTITVSLDVVDVDELIVATSVLAGGRYVRLRVRDTGSGIPAHVLERIFDPFFTTKEVGVGTGLGLSLVHGIVTDLGGGIDVESRPGQGAAFTVYLPWQGVVAAPETAAESIEPGAGETILLVDDEETLVRLGEEMIAGLGYEPVGFTSSAAALATFRESPQRFNAVLSDEAMPDMTGSELAREIRKIRPDIPIVLMSGYVTSALSSRAREAGVLEVLSKPLVARDIARSLAGALRP